MPTQDDQRFTPALSVERQTLMPVWCATAGALLIVGMTVLAYWPSLSGQFILDDNIYVTMNPAIAAPDGLHRIWLTTKMVDYYPFSNTTLWIEWRLWGLNPTGYRVTNLVLHVATTLLLWRVLRKLSFPGAYLAALLFALHPVNVESVAWISQRKGLLALVFFLLSILWYLRNDERRNASERDTTGWQATLNIGGWYWLSLLAFALSMLSKGSVAILPAVLLLIVWWQKRRITGKDVVRTTPFFLLALALTCLNVWFQTHGSEVVLRDAGYAERLAGAGAVVWFYLSKALAPIELVFIYPRWRIEIGRLLWWLPILAVATLSAALWWQRHSPQASWVRPLLFAWAFFCVTLTPVLGFTDVGFMQYSLVADHYQHIAIIAVLAFVSAAWSVWHNRTRAAIRWVATTTAVVLVGVLTLMTWQQNRMYGNPINLYKATLQENPDSWVVHSELGNVLMLANQVPEAVEQEQQALRLNPDHAETHNNLGVALYNQNKIPDALYHFQEAIYLNPGFAAAYFNRGNALFKTKRFEEAVAQYTEALRLNPYYVDAHVNLGTALATMGRLPQAVEQFELALQLDSDNLKVYSNLTTAYAQMQEPAKAIAAAQKALSLARSEGQTELALSIEAWLTNYRAQQPNSQNALP